MASHPQGSVVRCSEHADRVELDALRRGFAAIEAGVDDGQVSGVLEDSAAEEAVADDSDLQWADLAHDNLVGPIQEELRRRAVLLRSTYPFDVDGATLVRERPSAMYEYLLAASMSVRGQLLQDATRLFERVAAQVVASYFGSRAKSIHFGWPRDGNTSFTEAAREVQERTREWRWYPEEGLDATDVKDEGCDFIVWLDSVDGRVGQLFVVGQCACGNNWHDKLGDLKVEVLRRWFNPLSWVEPVRSFATPRCVTDERVLKEASRQGGLTFDRARLVLAAADQPSLDKETVSAMQRITRSVVVGSG